MQEARALENAEVASKLLEPGTVRSIADQDEKSIPRSLQHARQSGNQRVRSFVLLGGIPPANCQNDLSALWEARRQQRLKIGGKARFKFRVEPPGEPLNFFSANSLRVDQVPHGIFARRNHEVRLTERRAARPSERLPHFD